MYDILIKNGTIFDGTGKKDGFVADIAINGNTIEKVASNIKASARNIIDATGLYVAPGFIDVLNHSDTYLTLFTIPDQNSLISQGITTIIGGNCGASLAPLVSSNAIISVQKWTDTSQINVDWLRVSEFLNVLQEKNKLALNFGTLVGYSTVRNGLLKGEQRKLTGQEIEIAGFLIDQAQKEGAFGLSSGLVYSGEKFVSDEELSYILPIVAKNKGIFVVHLRNEAERLVDSIKEVISWAQDAQCKLHISHLKAIGSDNWTKFSDALLEIEKANEKGIEVTFDVFPYASNGLALYSILPAWAKTGNKEQIKQRLQDKKARETIKMDLRNLNLNYKKMTIASLAGDDIFLGKTIYDIAKNWEAEEEDVILDLLVGSNLKVIVFAHVLSEENVQKGIMHHLGIVTSDGAGYNIEYKKFKDMPHPRAFGAFPRFLRKYPHPKNVHIISYKEAIYKITGYPAKIFGIKKRGNIKPGFFADITIFDPNKIEEITTFEDPYHYSVGVNAVFVNGKLAYDKGDFKKVYAGKVLKKS